MSVELKTVNDTVIAHLRRADRTPGSFGYGISTAAPYVRAMLDVWQPEHVNPAELLKRAESELVYTSPDMQIEKVVQTEKKVEVLPKDVEAPPHTKLLIRHVLTTPKKDRDGDILRTEGATLDPKAPLLWQHMWPLPVGKVVTTLEQTEKSLRVVSAILDLNPLTDDIVKLVEADVLRFSHGFLPTEFKEIDTGLDIKAFEIMEASLVSVPSNTDAQLEVFSTTQMQSSLFKNYAAKVLSNRPTVVRGHRFEKDASVEIKRPSPKQFIPEHKYLNVEAEHLEASKLEYEWTSRFIGCEVKELMVTGTFVPRHRMGSFLTGVREVRNDDKHDTRRLTRDGKEKPPIHEVIQLNSEKSDTFLVDGIEFCLCKDTGQRYAVKFEPSWSGLYMTLYTDGGSNDLIEKSWAWAVENNFMKGEAFSLTGDFIKRNPDFGFENVFLESKNMDPIKRAVKHINDKGKDGSNRGLIFAGERGTGKTLSARIIMNQAKATYLWTSAKDFYRVGSIEGLCMAFEMAAELAPSVVCFEDIDHWLNSHAIDVIKSEMDGVRQTQGITTLLTTNFPERLPKELIDRPGRFHEVLTFDLPNEATRKQMLFTWMCVGTEAEKQPTSDSLEEAAKLTDGYSGAHIFELCNFAKTLQENDDVPPDESLQRAINKLNAQRETIGKTEKDTWRVVFYEDAQRIDWATGQPFTPTSKTATPFRSTPISEATTWDANAAVNRIRNWAKGEDDELDLQLAGHRNRYIQAFARVTGDGDNLADYGFPHHDIADGQLVVNRAAVSAGIAAVNGARGGANFESEAERTGVYRHLASHLREDFDVPADDVPALRSRSTTDGNQKQGRTLSKANITLLEGVVADLTAASESELPRAAEALVERAVGRLKGLLETVLADPEDADKQFEAFRSVTEALAAFLRSASNDELSRARGAIDSLLQAAELEAKAKTYRQLTG